MALQQNAHAHARQQNNNNGLPPMPTSLAQAGLYHSEHSEHSSTFKQNAASSSATKGSAKMVASGSNHRQASAAASSPARTANGDTPSGNASKKNAKSQQTIADELASALGSKKDRKRKRVHYSCAECHRRKHKCDRKIPCKPCVDRGIGEECRPFEEGDQHGDVRDRVTRLEDIVEGLALAQTTLAKELAAQGFTGTAGAAIGGLAGLAADVNARRANGKAAVAGGNMSRLTSRNGTGKGGDMSVDGGEDEDELEDENEEGEDDSPASASAAGAAGSDQQRPAKRMRTGKIGDKSDPDAHELEIERRTLDGQFANDGESWFGALALPSVSRGVIETEVRPSFCIVVLCWAWSNSCNGCFSDQWRETGAACAHAALSSLAQAQQAHLRRRRAPYDPRRTHVRSSTTHRNRRASGTLFPRYQLHALTDPRGGFQAEL